MPVCSDCGGTVIEYDAAAGNGFCVQCGTVIEENTIVNEVTFGETSTGAAMVQGSYVGQGATHARMGGPFGNRSNNESREQTIANANRKIQSIANVLHLSEVVVLSATRLYTLAVEHKFTKGRKSLHVVAVCLYVACRQKETRNYMLIDFSDLLQVNVFELGHTYLQLVQTLNLRLPLVDPSHYISRFAALLEFGDETHKVATDAIRLVQRFDRDWMTKGRRPAGICGACLLLAARMNNFRRSVEEIIQVVKIADTTLKKRLEEFKKTPSGALTLTDFRTVWLEEEMDPPAFIKGKEKERDQQEQSEEGEGEEVSGKKKKKKKGDKRKQKRKREEGEEEVVGSLSQPRPDANGIDGIPSRFPIDPSLLNQGILAGTSHSEPLFLPEAPEGATLLADDNANIDPALLGEILPSPPTLPIPPLLAPTPASAEALPGNGVELSRLVPDAESAVDSQLASEVSTFLNNEQGILLSEALAEADERRQAQFTVVDELLGLDDEELDKFLLTEEEVRVKERVWVEMNRDYLEAIAAKGEQRETGASKPRKRRKTNNKPRDTTTPHGTTAAESVRNLLKKNPKYSKRINYDALKELFSDGVGGAGGQVLYTMDDDKDDMMVVEEEGGGYVGRTITHEPTDEAEGDDGEGEGSEKGEYYEWEETYEQEV